MGSKVTRIWSDQAWLMSHWKDIETKLNQSAAFGWDLENNSKLKYTNQTYPNPVESFLKLNQRQLTVLQPFLKLQKIINGKPKEYKITQLQQTINEKTISDGKPEWVTVSSISLSRNEKAPGTPDDLISEIQFQCSSFKAMTHRRGGSDGVALIDFLKRETKNPGGARDDSLYPEDQTILIKFGWSKPDGEYLKNLQNQGFFKGEETQALQELNATYELTGFLNQYSINVEPTGELTINTTWRTTTAAKFRDPRINLLINPENPAWNWIKESQEKSKKGNQSEKDNINRQIEAALQTYSEEIYSSVYKKLKEERKIYEVTVPIESVSKYYEQADQPNAQEQQNAAREYLSRYGLTDSNYLSSGKIPSLVDQIKDSDSPGRIEFGQIEQINPDTPYDPSYPEEGGVIEKVIEFIPLGSIIDAFLKAGAVSVKDFTKEQISFSIGGININFPTESRLGDTIVQNKQLSYIPISMTVFNSWMNKFISGQRKPIVTLRDFLFSYLPNLILMAFETPVGVRDYPTIYNPKMRMFIGGKGGREVRIFFSTTVDQIGDPPTIKLGGSQAVIRNISFSKKNDSKHAETAFATPGAFNLTGLTRQPTEVQIEMYGCPHFENGTYIKVSASGIPDLDSNLADIFGFEGIFLILSCNSKWDKSGFFTTIRGIWSDSGKK